MRGSLQVPRGISYAALWGGVITCSIIAAWLLLILACSIPESCISKNAQESLAQINQEGTYPHSYVDGRPFDNFTVRIMLANAAHHEDDPLVASMTANYPRYWHGYLVVLKPLLCFMDLTAIRKLFQIVILVFLCLLPAMLASRYGKSGSAIGLMLSISYLLYGVAEASAVLPFFFSIFISLLGCAVICLIKSTAYGRILCIFSLLGIATAYFDFLDNPILTLLMPVAFLLLRDYHEKLSSRQIIGHVLIAFGFWTLSYAVFWASKWLIASFVLGGNVFADAAKQAIFRAGLEETSGLGYIWTTINRNLHVSNISSIVMLLLIVVDSTLVILCIKSRNANCQKALKCSGMLLVIGIVPYLWYALLSNHSYIHYWFTYRNQIASLFVLGCITCLLVHALAQQKRAVSAGQKNMETGN